MTSKEVTTVNIKALIGKGYKAYWESKAMYRILKGGRGSKKSVTTAYWYIYHLMKYPQANALVVRQTGNTHKDSTYALLKWAVNKLQVSHLWKFKENPMEAEYIPTGQKIIFRGFDDPLKLTSITVAVGVLCWVWIEEAFEIEDEAEFRTLDESIRGVMPDGLWKQITLTYNPWVNNHWTKKRFWDKIDPDAERFTTTYKLNEWLDDNDRRKIEALEYTDPDRFKVVGLGEYGIPGGAYFDEFRTDIHVCKPFVIPTHWTRYRSMDYGLDKLAVLWFAVSPQNEVFVYKELHESDHIVSKACQRIKEVNGTDIIRCTYAPSDLNSRQKDTGKQITELFQANGVTLTMASNRRIKGWYAVKEAIKVIESKNIETGEPIKKSNLTIFDNCINLISYLPQVQKAESDPNDVSETPHELTHICDSLRYYCVTRYNTFEEEVKPHKEDDTDRYLNEMTRW